MSAAGLYRQKHITKPWGYEQLLAHTPDYAMKLLWITAGSRISMQYHVQKTETLYVLYGKCHAFFGPSHDALARRTLDVHAVLHLPARTVHRLEAIEDTLLVETSTSHLDDVVRLDDDYGRDTL